MTSPLTSFSANTHLSDRRLQKERLLSGNIQVYYHHLWMSSWDLGKKQASETNQYVCVCECLCVCRPVTRSLGWKSEWEPWRRRVKAWGRHQHSGDVTKPLCTGSSQTLRQAYLLPLRDTHTHTHTLAHTHTIQVSLRVTDNLSISIKKPNSVIARISPLVQVCVHVWRAFFNRAMDSQRKWY